MEVGQSFIKIPFEAATSGTGTTDFALFGYATEVWVKHAGGATFSLTLKETNDAGEQTILALVDKSVASNVQYPVLRQAVESDGDAVVGGYVAYLMCGKISATLNYNTSVTGDAYIAIRYTT